tara:strand:- start:709 stop:1536 length:828 start_codon:yes stop_codon:yes gene_type:complete
MIRLITSVLIVLGIFNSLLADEPIAIAHRGLLRHAPENTLSAFAACLELRMGIELDIRTTSDGHLVVIHDDNLMRTTDGPSKSIRDITLAAVKQLDAGSWFDPAYQNERVPTLEETFRLIQKRTRAPTIIALNVKQITQEGEQKLIKLMDQFEMFDISFAFDQSIDVSRRLKQLDSRLRVGQNVNRGSIERVLEEGFIDVFLLSDTPTKAEVAMLHKNDKQALFNYAGPGEHRRSPAAWRQAHAAGIDGMLTDYPTLCQQLWRADKIQLDSSGRK